MKFAIPLLVLALMAPTAMAHGMAVDVAQPMLDQTFMVTGPQLAPEVPVFSVGADPASAAAWRVERAGDYDLTFRCPAIARQDGQPPVCPAYIIDTEDVLGQPVLSVDPRSPSFIAFNALHGGPGPELPGQAPPPSPGARADDVHQPHTTFQSRTGGAAWDDNRYYARLDGDGRIWGIDNAMAADPQGMLSIASVYAVDPEEGERQYKVVLTSAERAATPVDYDREYVVRDTLTAGDRLQDIHMIHSVGHDAMVAMWLEGDGALRTLYRMPDAPWRDAGTELGPCADISNPVAQGDHIYLLCRPAPGFDQAGIADNSVQMFSLDDAWNTTHVSTLPLDGLSDLALADARSGIDGGIVAAASGIVGGNARVQFTFGVDGDHWGPVKDYRETFSDAANRAQALEDVRINAMGYMGTSGTVHFIVAERYAGANGPNESPLGKTYGVIHHTGRLLGQWGLGYGDPASRAVFPAHVAGLSGDVFDDAKDSIVVHTTASGDERLFVAFGDHGVVRFAEILEVQPPLPGFPPVSPAAPVPTPLPGANPAIVGAVAGTLSTAAVARMVAAKKKKTAEAPSL